MINEIINYFLMNRKKKKLNKLVTFQGDCYDNLLWNRTSNISLIDGSTPKDIVFGNKVWMWGTLNSQSNGKIVLNDYVRIGGGVVVECVDMIRIGKYTEIAIGVFISDNNNHPINPNFRKYTRQTSSDEPRLWKHSVHAPVIIGENCWIGRDVSIMKGVTIGDNTVVAANSVVTKSIPANCIAAGNPAKVVKTDIDQIPSPMSCLEYNEYVRKMSEQSIL